MSKNQKKVLTFCSWPHFEETGSEHLMGHSTAANKAEPREEAHLDARSMCAARTGTRWTPPGLSRAQTAVGKHVAALVRPAVTLPQFHPHTRRKNEGWRSLAENCPQHPITRPILLILQVPICSELAA